MTHKRQRFFDKYIKDEDLPHIWPKTACKLVATIAVKTITAASKPT
jgi:hypothetical protein